MTNFIFFVISIFAIILKKDKILIALILISFLSTAIEIDIFNITLPQWLAISVIYTIFYYKSALRKLKSNRHLAKGIKLLSIFLLISFMSAVFNVGFCDLPLKFPEDSSLLITQGYFLRPIIASVNFLFQLISIVGLSCLADKLKSKEIYNIFSYSTICLVAYALISYFMNDYINLSLFTQMRPELYNRIHGLNVEPRSFGTACVLSFLYFQSHKSFGFQPFNGFLAKTLSLIGVILSLSLSSMISLIAALLVFNLLESKSAMKIGIQMFLFLSLIALILPTITPLLDNFSNLEIFNKFQRLTGDNYQYALNSTIDNSTTEIFLSRLEVFDRSGLRALLHNPILFLIGVGPGIISIVASHYLDQSSIEIYGQSVSSVPHIQVIYMLSWAGLVGIYFYMRGILDFSTNQEIPEMYFLKYNIILMFFVTPVILPFSIALASKFSPSKISCLHFES
jgi:hypothetical protein